MNGLSTGFVIVFELGDNLPLLTGSWLCFLFWQLANMFLFLCIYVCVYLLVGCLCYCSGVRSLYFNRLCCSVGLLSMIVRVCGGVIRIFSKWK